MGRWSRAFLNYAYEIIEISEVDVESLNDPFFPGFGGGGGFIGPGINPLFFGDLGKRRESRITPSYSFNRPSCGLQVAGCGF